MPDPIPQRTNEIAKAIIVSAFRVHSSLGPGLLESVYETCLAYELKKRGLKFLRQIDLPITYDDQRLNSGLRLDLLVEDTVIVELKAVEILKPVHEAQILTYLKLSGKRLGLLINFNVTGLKSGIRRFAL